MNNKHLPSNTVMALMMYDAVCEAYNAMVIDNHRRANPDHPKAMATRTKFEELKMLFESSTGLMWEWIHNRYGENMSARYFNEIINENED